MSDKDYYPPGAYSDPKAPCNQDDITESEAFETLKLETWQERMADGSGYMLEAITEREASDLLKLGRMVRDNVNGTHTEAIGALITAWITEYCEPDDQDIIDELNDSAECAADMAAEARYELRKEREND